MDDPKRSDAPPYDEDFLAWTEAQAEALRRRAGGNAIDYERVAEEIEDLGRSELFACESFLRRILEHLIKLGASRRPEAKAHWQAEIVLFRAELEGRLTPTIRQRLVARYPKLWAEAARVAALRMQASEPDTPLDLPAAPALALEEAIDPDFWPDAGAPR
jgi:hypothetical protein